MNITLNIEKLNKILVSFYETTGIRTVIFDSQFNEIISYPPDKCRFCRNIRADKILNEKCKQSDLKAFFECAKKEDIYIYKCHAGLVEAAKPLIYENSIVGYMMLGQITDIKDKIVLKESLTEYDFNCDISAIKYKSRKQIEAAAKILEICNEYIILKDIIALENGGVVRRAKDYIKSNLSTELKIEDICAFCDCGRTKLYKAFKTECKIGIAHYIMKKRMELAKKLLKSSELTVSEVSDACGFNDYNYFSRVYKKHYGISPRKDSNLK